MLYDDFTPLQHVLLEISDWGYRMNQFISKDVLKFATTTVGALSVTAHLMRGLLMISVSPVDNLDIVTLVMH